MCYYDDLVSIDPVEFEKLIFNLFENMGMFPQLTQRSHDGGIDLIVKDPRDIIGGIYIVQCKRFKNTVSSSIVRDLYGVVTHLRVNKGILITTGTISSEARAFAEGKPLELIDGEKLLKLLKEYNVLEINSFQKDFDNHKNNEEKTFRTLISEINTERGNNTLLAVVGIDEMSHAFTINVEEDTPIIIEGYPHSDIDDCINTIICSLIINNSPQLLKLLLIDAKIVELSIYNGLPHLLTPVITDINKANVVLDWAINEMVNRHKILAESHVRNIEEYNKLPNADIMPKIVIVINELSDLIALSQYEFGKKIIELAKKGWTVGIYLVIATSFPDTSSLNIKKSVSLSNINFISKNYMSINLFSTSEKNLKIRSIFVSRNEIEEIVSPLKSELYLEHDNKGTETNSLFLEEDELLNDAIKVIVETGQASISMLQRRLRIGYARAARIIDQLEQKGIISGYDGLNPRQILLTEEEINMFIKEIINENENNSINHVNPLKEIKEHQSITQNIKKSLKKIFNI